MLESLPANRRASPASATARADGRLPLGEGVDGDAAPVEIAEEARVTGAGRQATHHHALVLEFHGQGLQFASAAGHQHQIVAPGR